MNNEIFILGAADHEMVAIENLLKETGMEYVYAGFKSDNGIIRRCFASNANRANCVVVPGSQTEATIEKGRPVIFIECRVEGYNPVKIIDHHQPGDPGFGFPPEKFWEGSSIGQLFSYLKEKGLVDEPEEDLLLIAAGDHCLTHAYQGLCPGVDRFKLLEMRLEKKADFMSMEHAKAFTRFMEAKESLEKIVVDGVADAIKAGLPHNPFSPEAAAFLGITFISAVINQEGDYKESIFGDSEKIREWVKEKKSQGWVTYGDPDRGFAGAYPPKE